jgi:hypothetical protein
MPDPLDKLLAGAGYTRDDINPTSRLGQLFRRKGVEDSAEVKRIRELPRYRWQDDLDLEWVAAGLKSWLGKPPREDCKRQCGHPVRLPDCKECTRAFTACACHGEGEMTPRIVQVAALQAIHDFGGLLGPIRVGGGKTLISYLAGSVLDADRVLLLLPAKLIDKTKREFNLLRRHWMPPKRLHIISYELLSRDRGLAELEAYKPHLIIADEGQKLANPSAACTKRVNRHLTKHNKEAMYVDMTGTVTKRSAKEYHHRINWAIPDGLQALPRNYKELESWAEALDVKVPRMKRRAPGALLQFCTSDQLVEISTAKPKKVLSIVRQAYADRLLSSPGICGTEEQFDGAMSILINKAEYDIGQAVIEAFVGLRDNWEKPDGQPIDQASALWRHARELAQGFFYKWDPPAPKDWLKARREWAATVRYIIKHHRGIDTPLLAARAVDKGQIPWAEEARKVWVDIRPTFEPNKIPEWIDDSALQYAARWASKNVGIIWVHEVAFGERLAKETGLPYYGAGGRHRKKMIEDETKTCIASIAANAEGRNLQQFHRNLVMSCPPGGNVWEQMLGREHRDGQMADEITVELPLICYEQWDVFRQAQYDARYIEDTTKQAQKLNFADITVQSEDSISQRHASGDPLWCKDNATFFERED